LILEQDEKLSLLQTLQIMSTLFWGPDLEKCRALIESNYWEPLEGLLPHLGGQAVPILDGLKSLLYSFNSAQALFEELEEEYIRLFISALGGIPTPLYASCYARDTPPGKGPLMGEPALAMEAIFRSKGLSLAGEIGEPPDHLSIELEYLFYLLNSDWTEQNGTLIEEASAFAKDQMLPWVRQVEAGLAGGASPGRFYPLLVTLLVFLLQWIGTLTPGPNV
jgi:putative dimethyl sulfoxide reductase chaperone